MKEIDAIQQLDIEEKAKLVTGIGFWKTKECSMIGMPQAAVADGPNGMRVQHKRPSNLGMGKSVPATCFPTSSALASSFDEELIKSVGEHIGSEAAALGVSMVLGPGLNIKRSPLCGRNFEYFSEDPILSGKMAAAYVQGVQSTGVTACVKHFAANCREWARMFCDSRVDMQTLHETYLTGFEIAIKQGKAGAVMSAYNKLNGEYCNQNNYLLGKVLRGDWGFDGILVSDWGGSHDPVAALKAGADWEMPECRISATQIARAIHKGELEEAALDDSVRRIYNFTRRSESISRARYNIEEHDAFAQRVAEECLVLLKNEGGALPLDMRQKFALIGDFAKTPRYQGAGSSQVIPTKLSSLLEELKGESGFMGYCAGFKRYGGTSKKLIKRALKLAAKADTLIVCLGLDEQREAEGSDRQDLKIGENQTELLKSLKKTGKKIVVVLSCGSAVETHWDENADALLLAHLSGQAGARAIARALKGEVNPSGRLSETYPVNSGDEACAAVYNQSPFKTDFAEGIYVGYKYYTSQNKPVKYPFGYGLSYTQFVYGGFKVSEGGVECTVKNVGERAGATVVQVYITAPRSNLEVSPAELKAFKKVRLEAGEERAVFIPFDEYSFRIYSASAGAFVQGGKYEVSLRENAQKPLFSQVIDLGGAAPDLGEKLSYGQYYQSHLTENDGGYTPSKRMPASPDIQVADLCYCRGLTAKIFAMIAKTSQRSKDKMKSGMLEWLPVRTVMQYMGLNEYKSQGFLMMCDGRFFKGLKRLLSRKTK